VGGCRTLFFHLTIFFFNKNTDFCWEIENFLKAGGAGAPPAPCGSHIPDSIDEAMFFLKYKSFN